VIETRGRLLGIDHGTKVIGLAICDASWIAPRPLELLYRKNRAADFAHIQAIIAKQEIAAVVVGLPQLPPEYTEISQEHTVRRWASRLAAAVSIPVYFWHEGYSSFDAEQIAQELGAKMDRIDHFAAAVILQSFIEAHPSGTPLPPPIKQR